MPLRRACVDSSALTINVALIDDDSYGGGDMLACYAGAVRKIARSEGEASVHASTLLHGVSMMTSGVRYSLIIFVGGAVLPYEKVALDWPAEASALGTLMVDEAFLGRCESICGANATEAMRSRYERLRGGEGLGRVVERVVEHYGAPHLQPTEILAKVGAGQGMRDGACWSLRALLSYADDEIS